MNASVVDLLEDHRVRLVGDAAVLAQHLVLDLEGWRLRVSSNSNQLLDRLRHYFAHVLAPPGDVDAEVVAIEGAAPDAGVDFTDWKREPGKTGRKDSYHDLAGARLVRKVRTGMVFLQSERLRIAAGPCLEHENQVINFINAQYMNRLQQNQWLICHAAAVVHADRAFALAGFSGGGKSTLMLHLLEHGSVNYLTNDRLFLRKGPSVVEARGIPKLPRVNPGTIVHNARLHSLIEPETRKALLALPPDELWTLEDKFDVMVDEVYGARRIETHAPFAGLVILNWQRGSEESAQVVRVDPDSRRDLLGAVMKSPGPFYQYADGRFFQDTEDLLEAPYLSVLKDTPVYEVTGGVDFDSATRQCLQEVMSREA